MVLTSCLGRGPSVYRSHLRRGAECCRRVARWRYEFSHCCSGFAFFFSRINPLFSRLPGKLFLSSQRFGGLFGIQRRKKPDPFKQWANLLLCLTEAIGVDAFLLPDLEASGEFSPGSEPTLSVALQALFGNCWKKCVYVCVNALKAYLSMLSEYPLWHVGLNSSESKLFWDKNWPSPKLLLEVEIISTEIGQFWLALDCAVSLRKWEECHPAQPIT